MKKVAIVTPTPVPTPTTAVKKLFKVCWSVPVRSCSPLPA
jgi:hypothetical protein